MQLKLKYLISYILLKITRLKKIDESIKNFFNVILVLFLGSNHPRRVSNLKKKITNQYLNDYEKITFKSLLFSNIKDKKISIFVGDSHAEYYGRNFIKKKNFFLTYHLGPVLLMSFSISQNLSDKIFNLIKYINIFKSKKTISIIFSMGEIDIRNIYYQMLILEKKFRNENDLSKFIATNFVRSYENIYYKLKKKNILNIKFYFLEIPPVTIKKFYLPKNLKQLEKIRLKNEFPIIGSLNQRIKWRNNLSKNLESICKKNHINFLKLDKKNFDSKGGAINKLKSIDLGHISDVNLISSLQTKI
jgi:hypothetical protein